MQIRTQGKQVQLIRSPYDPIKKRCTQKVIATFPVYENYDSLNLHDHLSAEHINLLSADEVVAVTTWLTTRVAKADAFSRERSIREAGANICKTADAISSDGIDFEGAQKIYLALDMLKKALKKAGHKREKSVPTEPKKQANQGHLTLD